MFSKINIFSQQTLLPKTRKATFLPVILLYALAVAVVLCLGVMTTFYGYWLFEKSTSQYRRQLHAAADNTQLFFDQREQLLRLTIASAVPNVMQMPVSKTPDRIGTSHQIELYPLQNGSDRYAWGLVLMPRAIQAYRQMQVELVYTSMVSGHTYPVMDDDAVLQTLDLSPETQRWIHHMLSTNAEVVQHQVEPEVWLIPPGNGFKDLYIYMPIDAAAPEAGWLGLAIPDIVSKLDLSPMRGSSYALYTPEGRVVVQSGDVPPSVNQNAVLDQWYSKLAHFVLSKPVGDAGWHLRYFMSRDQLLHDVLPRWSWAILLFLLAVLGVALGSRYIHRRILQPANAQVKQLAETVALNEALLKASPVGLALVRRRDHAMLLSNDLAHRWLSPAQINTLVNTDTTAMCEEHSTADGRVVQSTLTPLNYAGEAAVLCTLNDITTIKQAEHSLRAAKQAAEQASQAKTNFLATMSHEIRTPLYGVIGALELLSLTTTTDRQRHYLEALQHSSSSLLSTVNNTLDLARIEEGHQPVEELPFSPLQLVEDVVTSFAMRAESKGLNIYHIMECSTPAYVRGDAKLLRRVLDNLVNNAIKFTESGSVAVRVHCSYAGNARVRLQFQVVDTGIGISQDDIERVFEPYFRADVDTVVPGTGLGLSICSRLAEVMHARLQAKSQLGMGTSMELDLVLPVDTSKGVGEAPILLPQLVYVRGGVPDVVSSVCDWLKRWGAKAQPYRADRELEGAVLVEVWPWAMPLAAYQGPKVLAHPLSQSISAEHISKETSLASAYSILGIGHAVFKAQKRHAEIATPAPAPAPASSAKELRVLVVEDHPVTRAIVQEQLQELGCTVEVAINGQEALQLPHIFDFNLIFTDINMPKLNGYELSKALRKRGYQPKIIGLTARVGNGENQAAEQAGMNHLLTKPLSMKELRKIVYSAKEL